jgi:intein/homing endonuclease
MVLIDPLLFALAFWEEDLTIPKSRLDLPEKWRGRQVVSLEQRKMIYDGAVYRLLRDVMPQEASESSQKVAHRTSRKIGKTLFIESTLIQLALTCTSPGTTEGMFHTPRENHMAPVRNRLESKIVSIPLFRMMFLGFDAATGIMNWRTGWIWHFRIEGMCLHGSTKIVDADTGAIYTLEGMARGNLPGCIHTFDVESGELGTTSDFSVLESGEQEVFEVICDANWSVRATANHPFLTPEGWKPLLDLHPGDTVAMAGRLSAFGETRMDSGAARLLGYFVGDGCLTSTNPLFTNDDPGIVADWRMLCEQFSGITVKELQKNQYAASGNRGVTRSSLITFLKEHDVWGKSADQKRTPRSIMAGTNEVIAEFLSGLFATDGSIAFKATGVTVISFASINRDLVEDAAYLLLRLGIRSKLEYRASDDRRKFGDKLVSSRELWSLRFAERDAILRFCELVHLRGRKGERQTELIRRLPGRVESGHGLTLPMQFVERARLELGMPRKKMARLAGVPSFHYESEGVRYDTVSKLNQVLCDSYLDQMLKRDVVWVSIKSIASAGVEPTYDLVVPNSHSFVGNQWILHNSNTGTNMVGLRAYAMIGDEADYSQSAPYIEREQTALPGCAQLWGGVPRGVRGVFWQICNTIEGRSWSVHRYDIRANPLYHSQTAFADQIKGDWYSQRVQTQVLGRDGEEAVSSFPVIPVDSSLHYVVRKFTIKEYEKFKDGLQKFLDIDLAIAQGEDSDAWMIHMDYGYAPSPTQIGISFLKGGLWRLVCRIEIMRVDTTPMANIIATIDTKILPKRAALIVLDAHGQGRGVLSALHTGEAWDQENYVNRAIPVGFEGSTPVPNVKVHRKCKQPVRQENDGYWSCDTCHNRIFDERELSDAMRQTKSYLTDVLKEDFANGARLLNSAGKDWPGGIAVAIGDDAEVVEELAGTTEIQSQGGSTRYITPKDQDHMTDMLRCLASGAERYVSLMTDWAEFNPNEFGWGDGMFQEKVKWNAPWGTFSD